MASTEDGTGRFVARRLTPALTATGATAPQVVKQLLDATASLIRQWLKHRIADSATHRLRRWSLPMLMANRLDRRLPNLLLPWASRARSNG